MTRGLGKLPIAIAATFLMVALTSCTPAAAPPAPTAATEKPQSGGTLTALIPTEQIYFDEADLDGASSTSLHLTNEKMTTGDRAKSPAGSNEFDFYYAGHFPQFETGLLAESWEIPDNNTIIFHLRKGVTYALNPNSEASKLVSGREMTVQDWAYAITRKFAAANYFGKSRPGWFDSATATDKYTVTIKGHEGTQKSAVMFMYLRDLFTVYPPEVVQKYGDMKDWRNAVGTGPFMLTDYVRGSSFTFAKNPNYWMKDPVGPGAGSQLPYLDGVKWLVIPDKSTRLAAIRTGKVDVYTGASSDLDISDYQELSKSNPQLQWKSAVTGAAHIYWKMDNQSLPFKDINVRKALSMAIDYEAIKKGYYQGEAEYPVSPLPPQVAAYTSLDKLPATTKELFQYNPEKAKQLLAQAGFPNGFNSSIIIRQRDVDLLAIVQNYWAKIGVNVATDLKDDSTYASMSSAHTHTAMFFTGAGIGWGTQAYLMVTTTPGLQVNKSFVDDPKINEWYDQMFSFDVGWGFPKPDVAKQDQIQRDYNLYTLSQAFWVQLPAPKVYRAWSSKVKGYYGESGYGYGNDFDWVRWTWLAQ